jgi:hypothetical protein
MRDCEEIRVFGGRAERTGNHAAFRSTKNYPACSSVRDLRRKYRIFGDGIFYLESGRWPAREVFMMLAADLADSFQEAFQRTERTRRQSRQAQFLHTRR